MRLRPWSLLVVLVAVPALAAPVPDWVKESDALAQPMLKITAQFFPEGAETSRRGGRGRQGHRPRSGLQRALPGRAGGGDQGPRGEAARRRGTRRFARTSRSSSTTASRRIDAEQARGRAAPPLLHSGPHGLRRDLRPARPSDPEGAAGRGAGAAPPLRRASSRGARRITELAKARTVEQLGEQEAPRSLQARGGAGARGQQAAGRRHRRAVQEVRRSPATSRRWRSSASRSHAYDAWVTAEILPALAQRQPTSAGALRGLPPQLRGDMLPRGRPPRGADRLRRDPQRDERPRAADRQGAQASCRAATTGRCSAR